MLIIFFILGLMWGSFANVLIFRLRSGDQFVKGRSRCPRCKKLITWYQNIPLLSFLILGGKCAHCKKPISWQYPLVELAAGVLFVLAALGSGLVQTELLGLELIGSANLFALMKFLYFAALAVIFLVIFVYDVRWQEIPDEMIKAGFVIALLFLLFGSFYGICTGDRQGIDVAYDVLGRLIGAILTGGFFYFQYYVSKGRWIGGGDIKLGALLGFLVGWTMVYPLLFFAYVAGALVGVSLLTARSKKWSSKLAFGPFLVASCFAVLLLEETVRFWFGRLIW